MPAHNYSPAIILTRGGSPSIIIIYSHFDTIFENAGSIHVPNVYKYIVRRLYTNMFARRLMPQTLQSQFALIFCLAQKLIAHNRRPHNVFQYRQLNCIRVRTSPTLNGVWTNTIAHSRARRFLNGRSGCFSVCFFFSSRCPRTQKCAVHGKSHTSAQHSTPLQK